MKKSATCICLEDFKNILVVFAIDQRAIYLLIIFIINKRGYYHLFYFLNITHYCEKLSNRNWFQFYNGLIFLSYTGTWGSAFIKTLFLVADYEAPVHDGQIDGTDWNETWYFVQQLTFCLLSKKFSNRFFNSLFLMWWKFIAVWLLFRKKI